MGSWVVMLKTKSRTQFPEVFLLTARPEYARALERRVRDLFEAGTLKDFMFEPVEGTTATQLSDRLVQIEGL